MERGEALVDQDLIDYHLREQRSQQREELKNEGGQQHLSEDPAVLHDLRDEPGKIKRPILWADRGAQGHEQELAAPDRLELLTRQHERARLVRSLSQDLLSVRLREDQIAPIGQPRERRQRGRDRKS